MAVQGIARRYAEAIFDIATENEDYDTWLEDLRVLASAASDDEVGGYFENPGVPAASKRQTLESMLPGDEHGAARNLAEILISRQRFDQLPGILESYEELVLEARGMAVANVTTAVELTDTEEQAVREGLQRILGRELVVRPHVDPGIIGGIVARVGDQLIDGSVKSQLQEMRMALGRR